MVKEHECPVRIRNKKLCRCIDEIIIIDDTKEIKKMCAVKHFSDGMACDRHADNRHGRADVADWWRQ